MYLAMSDSIFVTAGLALTVWVARTIRRNGRVFLMDAFQGNTELADSVNRLLVFGFYLAGVGYVTLFVGTSRPLESALAVVEVLLERIGGLLLVLGIAHFLVLFVLRRMRIGGPERSGHARPPHGAGGWSPESAPLGKVLD